MSAPTSLEESLRRDEGEVLHVYQDSMGYWTLGVGRLVDARRGGSISKAECANMLANDIAEKTAQLAARLPWSTDMDPVRRETLINLCFQLGIDGLLQFRGMLTCVQAENWDGAALALKNSKLHAQTPDRTERHMEQLITGIRQ